jgi:hypothetical protein
MDESKMPVHEAELLRARLHLRSGRRRLGEGKLRAGVETMYDALYSAMRAYVLNPTNRHRFEGVDISNEQALYEALVGAGALDGRFEFMKFKEMVEKAVNEKVPVYDHGYDPAWLISGVETAMTQLGGLPFDESTLTMEDPATF